MYGRLSLRIIHGGAATLHSIRVMQPKQVVTLVSFIMKRHAADIADNDGNRAKLKSTSSPVFETVLKSGTFVDKSGLILAFFEKETEGILLFTAPRRFGKTVNLSMMQKFLELEVDANGKEKTTVLEDKDNYKLFKSARSELIVMRNKKFVETHFGQYPMIKLDLLCRERDAERLSDAVMVCRKAIGRAFTKHSYLYESNESPLKHFEKKICERWCDTFTYKVIPDDEVAGGLACLAEYLNKFHKKKVFLLVDEYDSIVSNALYNVKAADRQAELNELERIAKFPIRVIGCVKDCSNFFQGAYITGILDIAGTGISSLLGSVRREKFGTENTCQDFYGFNEAEVRTLFNRWGVDEELQKKAMIKYNGYSNGAMKPLYNPQSIANFLDNLNMGEGALKNYWKQSGYIQNLYSILQQDDVRHLINELLQGVKENVDIDIDEPLELLDLKELHDLLIHSDLTCDVDIVYKFLVSLGYLTYSENDGTLKIPNSEVIDEFKRRLRNYFYRRYGINKRYAKACADSFSKLARLCGEDDDLKFEEELAYFQNNITSLFQQSDLAYSLTEASVRSIITLTCAENGFIFQNEITIPEHQTRSDAILYNDTFGCVVEIKCGPKTVEDALKQIFTSHYYNVFTNTKNTKYFNDRQKTPCLSLLMGLHVDSEKKASVRCLRRKDIIDVLNDLKIEADPSLETRIKKALKPESEKAVKSKSCIINTFCKKAIPRQRN